MMISDKVIIAVVVALPVLGFVTGAWVMWWYAKDILADVRDQVRSLTKAREDEAKAMSDAAQRIFEHAVGGEPNDVPGSKRAEPQAGPLGLPGGSYTGVADVVFDDEVVTGEIVDTGEHPLLDMPTTTKVVEVRQGTFTPDVPSLSEPLIEFIENTSSTVVHEPTCKLVPEWSRDTDRFEKLWQMTRTELSELISEGKMRACKQCRPDRAKETV